MVMGQTAEIVAKRYGVSRLAQDQIAFSSQQRTAEAQQSGFFAREIVPMEVTRALLDKQGEVVGTGTIRGGKGRMQSARYQPGRPEQSEGGVRPR